MELISFIKSLLQKGKMYHDVWLPILFSLEENKQFVMNKRLDISNTQYYRIIRYGISLFNYLVPNMRIEHKKGILILIEEQITITKNKSKQKSVKEPKKNELEVELEVDINEVYENIISYLNQKANTSYQSKTNSHRNFINSRFKSGYKIEDFYKVIDNKSSEWMGTDFQKFLRPETLFGNKFDSYLNQNTTIKTSQEKAYEQVNQATEIGWNKHR